MDQWAEVYEELECPRYSVFEDVTMLKGEHPHLGVVVAIQMMDDAISITTTVPFTDRAERQSGESGNALARAVVVAATSRTPAARMQAGPTIADALREADLIAKSQEADAVFGSRSEIDIDDLEATLAELDQP